MYCVLYRRFHCTFIPPFPQVAELKHFPYTLPLGMKQADVDQAGMELEEDGVSLDDSLEGGLGNDMLALEEDSDEMDSSSVQDLSALNDTS